MTPSSPAIRNLCYLPVYFGTDVPDLRLALHRQQSAHKRRFTAMTSTPHLIDHWLWLPRALPLQGFYLRELQKKLSLVHRPRSGKTNLTLHQDL